MLSALGLRFVRVLFCVEQPVCQRERCQAELFAEAGVFAVDAECRIPAGICGQRALPCVLFLAGRCCHLLQLAPVGLALVHADVCFNVLHALALQV